MFNKQVMIPKRWGSWIRTYRKIRFPWEGVKSFHQESFVRWYGNSHYTICRSPIWESHIPKLDSRMPNAPFVTLQDILTFTVISLFSLMMVYFLTGFTLVRFRELISTFPLCFQFFFNDPL